MITVDNFLNLDQPQTVTLVMGVATKILGPIGSIYIYVDLYDIHFSIHPKFDNKKSF